MLNIFEQNISQLKKLKKDQLIAEISHQLETNSIQQKTIKELSSKLETSENDLKKVLADPDEKGNVFKIRDSNEIEELENKIENLEYEIYELKEELENQKENVEELNTELEEKKANKNFLLDNIESLFKLLKSDSSNENLKIWIIKQNLEQLLNENLKI
jgi:chromosome segregation ATPase